MMSCDLGVLNGPQSVGFLLGPPPVGALIGPLLLLLLLLPHGVFCSLGREYLPRSVVYPEDLHSLSFPGNITHADHFRLLQRDHDSLLIGARNIIYNITIHNLQENRRERVLWPSRRHDSLICFSKGKTEDECHNYIRVLVKKGDGRFLMCGTNAFKPLCRQYKRLNDGSFRFTESSGVGKCPFSPSHNSTFVYTDGELYSGTVADFQGITPLIFREPLKTDHNDYKQLNAPDFVHSFAYGDFVWFFFRETATEYMNCGKRVYSRVGRVCKSDRGGATSRHRNSWTSFLKTRLNCSMPGEYPFYFDEIQSSSDVIRGTYGNITDEIIYAVFTTPINSISGSAVCAFSMKDVIASFQGQFKEQESLNSNWLPTHHSKVPTPRPGRCVDDSKQLQESHINFIKNHPLMDKAVQPFFGQPLIVKTSFEYRFTQVAVDHQVPLVGGGAVDVLFIATDKGTILKTINTLSSVSAVRMEPVIIEDIRAVGRAIVNLQIAKQPDSSSKLIIITDVEVKSIDLHRCGRTKSCGECIKLQDPYCGWFLGSGHCAGLNAVFAGPILQNVTSGTHSKCPNTEDNEIILKHPLQKTKMQEAAQPKTATTATTTTAALCRPCVCPQTLSTVSDPVTVVVPLGGSLVSPPSQEIQTEEAGLSARANRTRHLGRALDFNPIESEKETNGTFDQLGSNHSTDMHGFAYAEGNAFDVILSPSSELVSHVYPAETLAVTVVVTCIAALVVGFIAGFLVAHKLKEDKDPQMVLPHLEAKLKKQENSNSLAVPNMYGVNTKQINNMVINISPKTNNTKENNTDTEERIIKPSKCAYI